MLQIKYSPVTYEHNRKDLILHINFSEQILVLKLFPSMKPELIAPTRVELQLFIWKLWHR